MSAPSTRLVVGSLAAIGICAALLGAFRFLGAGEPLRPEDKSSQREPMRSGTGSPSIGSADPRSLWSELVFADANNDLEGVARLKGLLSQCGRSAVVAIRDSLIGRETTITSPSLKPIATDILAGLNNPETRDLLLEAFHGFDVSITNPDGNLRYVSDALEVFADAIAAKPFVGLPVRIKGIYPTLRAQVVREAFLRLIGKLLKTYPELGDFLSAQLSGAEDPKTRAAAARAFGLAPSPEAATVCLAGLSRLLESPKPQNREELYALCGTLVGSMPLEDILGLLRSKIDGISRQQSLQVLGTGLGNALRFAKDQGNDALIQALLESNSENMKIVCLKSLQYVAATDGDPRVVGLASDILAHSTDDIVCSTAIEAAIANASDQATVIDIIKRTENGNNFIKGSVGINGILYCIRHQEAAEAANSVTALMASGDKQVRLDLIKAFSDIGTSGPFAQKLRQFSVQDPDPDIRHAAAHSLEVVGGN